MGYGSNDFYEYEVLGVGRVLRISGSFDSLSCKCGSVLSRSHGMGLGSRHGDSMYATL